MWVDANGNGATDTGELRTLAEAGITTIGLRATAAKDYTIKAGDNAVLSTVTFTRANGTTGTAGNVSFGFRPGDVQLASAPGPGTPGPVFPDGFGPEGTGPDDFGEDPTSTVRIDPGIESAIRTLTASSSGRVLSIFDLPSDAAAFDAFAMGSSALAPASSAPQAIAASTAQATQAMPDSLRALEPVSPSDIAFSSLDDQAPASSLDDQAMSRKLALLRQDMAGFGGRFAETSRDWRSGDGLRPVEFFG